MSRVGPTRAIWRQSSDPIEPPAPVTSTVWPLRYDATSSKSTSTCSRPSTSSTCTGRIWPARSRSPEMSSYRPGSVFTGTFPACAASTTSAAHLARGGRDRDQHLVGLVLAHEPWQLGHRPEHPDAEDARVPLARVVVDEPDRRVGEHARALHFLHDEPAGVARADDDDLLAACDHAVARALHHGARQQTRARDQRQRDEQIRHRDRARQADVVHRRCEVDGDVGHERGERRRRVRRSTCRAPRRSATSGGGTRRAGTRRP